MSPPASTSRPTDRQLRYLKSLAQQTGTSFVHPQTRREASDEIDRLLQLKKSGHVPPLEATHLDERDLVYATAVQPGEVSGYGSTASWHSEPSGPVATAPPSPSVGERTELARYPLPGGERVLYGQRINGVVRITDRPASGEGRSYLVERELEHDGYSALKALVGDYLEQARRLDEIPMASSVVRRELERVTVDV